MCLLRMDGWVWIYDLKDLSTRANKELYEYTLRDFGCEYAGLKRTDAINQRFWDVFTGIEESNAVVGAGCFVLSVYIHIHVHHVCGAEKSKMYAIGGKGEIMQRWHVNTILVITACEDAE